MLHIILFLLKQSYFGDSKWYHWEFRRVMCSNWEAYHRQCERVLWKKEKSLFDIQIMSMILPWRVFPCVMRFHFRKWFYTSMFFNVIQIFLQCFLTQMASYPSNQCLRNFHEHTFWVCYDAIVFQSKSCVCKKNCRQTLSLSLSLSLSLFL